VVGCYNESKVSCLLCPAEVGESKSYNTTRHLEINHEDKFVILMRVSKEKYNVSSTGSSTQPIIIHSSMKSQPFLFEHSRAKEITKKVGETIALDSKPYNTIYHVDC